ncbi:MAG: glutaredoxin family protein [Candidatus Lokiarchaeota archaeon]|nr:glutaredoxin family protein [Candidatus Lokiarchaeota archaeon]
MSFEEDLEFTKSQGEKNGCKITVYALSTCGFCKRALAFLRDNSVDFSFLYVDKLDKETKDNVTKNLKEKFDRRVAFPFLIIDGKECMVGFNTEKYENLLDIIESHKHDI